MSEISVVLIEDHDLTRIGLVAAINQFENIKVVGDASNGNQGLKVLAQTKPDVAIIDIGLPDIDGIELTQKLKQLQKETEEGNTKVIILTMHDKEDSVLSAFAAGADSYSLKDVSLENLNQAIEITYEGESWIDPTIARVVLQQAKKNYPQTSKKTDTENNSPPVRQIESLDSESQEIVNNFPLTDRELEVLELIVAGCNNAQIADKLFVSVGTIKTHVRNILNKLCVDDRTQAAVCALRSGLVG